MIIKDKNKIINTNYILEIEIEEYDDGICRLLYCNLHQRKYFTPRFSSLEKAEKCFFEIITEIANKVPVIDLYDICQFIKEKERQEHSRTLRNTKRTPIGVPRENQLRQGF